MNSKQGLTARLLKVRYALCHSRAHRELDAAARQPAGWRQPGSTLAGPRVSNPGFDPLPLRSYVAVHQRVPRIQVQSGPRPLPNRCAPLAGQRGVVMIAAFATHRQPAGAGAWKC